MTGARVLVARWRDLAGARRTIPAGFLAVLVDGQHAGAIAREGATWQASWHTARYGVAARSDRVTEHGTAEDAVRAVVRSGWARKLGARAGSSITWTAAARKVAAR